MNTITKLHTNFGVITLELWGVRAPKTVANFLEYAKNGSYDGTIFHRVIQNFMIQGGGFTEDMQQRPTQAPIKNEANPELKNDKGTISMARTNAPHSATCQFFINTRDNGSLNYNSESSPGYCVFGHVIDGYDIVDNIEKVKTTRHGMHQDVPSEPVIIEKVTIE